MDLGKVVDVLDSYFRAVFFKPLEQEKEGLKAEDRKIPIGITKEAIEKFSKKTEDGMVLDVQSISQELPYSCLFPQKPNDPTGQDWKYFDRWFQQAKDTKKLGGVIRFFIEQKEEAKFLIGFKELIDMTKEIFSIPEEFFIALQKLGIYAVYEEKGKDGKEIKTFTWDFSGLLYIEPKKTVYNAYRRYAYSQYNRRYIEKVEGCKDLVAVLAPDYKIISDKLLSVIKSEKPLSSGMPKRLNKEADLIEDLIEEALQSLSKEDRYIPMKLEGLKKRFYFLKGKKKSEGPFNKKDRANINNYCSKMYTLLSNLGMEQEKKQLEDARSAGPYTVIQKIYSLIKNPKHPELGEAFKKKNSLGVIEGLYWKSLGQVSLNAEVNDDDSKQTRQDMLPDEHSKTPDEEFLQKEEEARREQRLKCIIPCFEKEFSDDPVFLRHIREMNFGEFFEALLVYADDKKGSHKTNNAIFKAYKCEKPPEVTDESSFHTLFAKRIKRVFNNMKDELKENL